MLAYHSEATSEQDSRIGSECARSSLGRDARAVRAWTLGADVEVLVAGVDSLAVYCCDAILGV